MPKTITSIGSLDDLGCCILGLGGMGFHAIGTDDMLGISGVNDDADYIDDPADPEPLVSDFDPAFIPTTMPALSLPDPGPGGSLTPKPAGWFRGDGSYIVQRGDTLAGLARIYLGDAGRFRAIWDVQSTGYRSTRTPDRIVVGDQLVMPPEAQKTAQSRGYYKPGTVSVSSSSSSSSTPPVVTAPIPKPAAVTPASHKVALGVAAAVTAGMGLLLWHPPASGQRRATARRRR